MAIPITCFEKWGYQKKHQISSDLYKATGKTEWIRIPALIANGKCTVIEIATQISAIAELAFNGLRLTLNPYQSPEQRQYGWTLLKNIHCKAFGVIGSIIVGTVLHPIMIVIDPKSYILSCTHTTRINLIYAEEGGFGTEDHAWDLVLDAPVDILMEKNWKNQLDRT